MRWRTWAATAVVIVAALLVLGECTPPAKASAAEHASAAAWHTERMTWYGPGFYGNRTACGKTMTRKLIGVAARGIACGTTIELRTRHHHRFVKVVDHGPYGVPWHLDATARLMIHLAGHPPHSLRRVRWRVIR